MVAFPLLLIPLAIFNIVIFMMPGLSLATEVASVTLRSGEIWSISASDTLLALALLLLLCEMTKAARPGAKTIVELLLAILLCGGAIAEFVMLPKFATSTFFLLVVMTVVDVIGSIAIGRHSRRARAVVTTPVVAVPTPATPPTPPSTVTEPAPVEPGLMDVRKEPSVPAELQPSPPGVPANDTADHQPPRPAS